MRGAAVALLVLAAPALAEGGPSAEAVARLGQAIAAAGCEVNELNQAKVLAEAEMAEAEAGVIVSEWIDAGAAVYSNGRLRLFLAGCPKG